jgi:hypothetical protein
MNVLCGQALDGLHLPIWASALEQRLVSAPGCADACAACRSVLVHGHRSGVWHEPGHDSASSARPALVLFPPPLHPDTSMNNTSRGGQGLKANHLTVGLRSGIICRGEIYRIDIFATGCRSGAYAGSGVRPAISLWSPSRSLTGSSKGAADGAYLLGRPQFWRHRRAVLPASVIEAASLLPLGHVCGSIGGCGSWGA